MYSSIIEPNSLTKINKQKSSFYLKQQIEPQMLSPKFKGQQNVILSSLIKERKKIDPNNPLYHLMLFEEQELTKSKFFGNWCSEKQNLDKGIPQRFKDVYSNKLSFDDQLAYYMEAIEMAKNPKYRVNTKSEAEQLRTRAQVSYKSDKATKESLVLRNSALHIGSRIQYDARCFLCRKSTKNTKNCLILENTAQSSNSFQKIRVTFSETQQFEQFLVLMLIAHRQYLKQNFIIRRDSFLGVQIVLTPSNKTQFNREQDFPRKGSKLQGEQILRHKNNPFRGDPGQIQHQKASKRQLLSTKHDLNEISLSDQGRMARYSKKLLVKPDEEIALWNNWLRQQNGTLICTNKKKLQGQRGIIKHALKKIVQNVMEGKSIFNISLPVRMFENISLTQKSSNCLGFVPLAFQQFDPQEQRYHQKMKCALVANISNAIMFIQPMAKPFNSVLGQTYQGYVQCCPAYAEQISHHPPITAFFMKGRGYFVYGNSEPRAEMKPNRFLGHNAGVTTVAFEKGYDYSSKQEKRHQRGNTAESLFCDDNIETKISFTQPKMQMSGMIFGDRTMIRVGQSYIYDEDRKIFGRLHWGIPSKDQIKFHNLSPEKSKQHDYMYGKIYKLKANVAFNSKALSTICEKDYQELLYQIECNWIQSLYINGRKQFDFQQELPYECIDYEEGHLESHSNLRIDIQLKRKGEIEKADEAKEVIEIRQREDRKLREHFQKVQNN